MLGSSIIINNLIKKGIQVCVYMNPEILFPFTNGYAKI